MSGTVDWIGAQAEPENVPNFEALRQKREKKPLQSQAYAPDLSAIGLPEPVSRAHQFPSEALEEKGETASVEDSQLAPTESAEDLSYAELHERDLQTEEQKWEERRQARELHRQQEMDREADLRRYRGRTVKLLRRYLRMAIEAGRLPSMLGSAFFCSGVTSYSVVTFEDRVIFVRDMEICLEQLDEFSRQVVVYSVLQEHSLPEAARVLRCDEKTIRRQIPLALDDCSEILLKKGLLESLDSNREESCQGGENDDFPVK